MTADGAEIRRAAAGDLDHIVNLQFRAYAANRAILGVEPLPLLVDYPDLLARMDTWVAEANGELAGVLIMDFRPDDALVWSVASDPALQGSGLGRRMMLHAEHMARERHRHVLRLYTGAKLIARVAWYARLGYATERTEILPDRTVVHMVKHLA